MLTLSMAKSLKDYLAAFLLVSLCVVAKWQPASAQEEGMETVNGTVYCNNEFKLWIDGVLIAEDPIPFGPHNAYNVSFQVAKGKDITFGIQGIDWAGDTHGLEFDGRCVGAGGLRAMFDNGVVTNSEWKCWTYHYGPVNWQECYAVDDRDPALKVLPGCMQESTPPLDGCWSRLREVPEGWSSPDFDDSHWEYAVEWNESYVGWGARPPGCEDPNNTVSTQVDPEGVNLTCPENLDWGAFGPEAQFIWRDDLHLDNRILCRYTLRQESEDSSASPLSAFITTSILVPFAVALGWLL